MNLESFRSGLSASSCSCLSFPFHSWSGLICWSELIWSDLFSCHGMQVWLLIGVWSGIYLALHPRSGRDQTSTSNSIYRLRAQCSHAAALQTTYAAVLCRTVLCNAFVTICLLSTTSWRVYHVHAGKTTQVPERPVLGHEDHTSVPA